MKIVVVSDNHGRSEPLEQILELHRDADVFIHCGDSELPPQFLQGYVCVRGNNDFYYEYPEMKILELEGHRMMIVHGHHHLYMGQLDMLVSKARRAGLRLCVLRPYAYLFQPAARRRDSCESGALSRNRDGTPPCYAVITIDGSDVSIDRVNWTRPRD